MEVLPPVPAIPVYQRPRLRTRVSHKILGRSKERFARTVGRSGSRDSRRTNSSSDSDAFFGAGSETVYARNSSSSSSSPAGPKVKRLAVDLPTLTLPVFELVDTSPVEPASSVSPSSRRWMTSPEDPHPGTPWSWTPGTYFTPREQQDAAPKFQYPVVVAAAAAAPGGPAAAAPTGYFELEGDTPTTPTAYSPGRHFGNAISTSPRRGNITHNGSSSSRSSADAASTSPTCTCVDKPPTTPASILKPARTVRAASHPPTTHLKLSTSTPNFASPPKAVRWSSNLADGHRPNHHAGSIASSPAEKDAQHHEPRGLRVPPGSHDGRTPTTFDCELPDSAIRPNLHTSSPFPRAKPLPPTPPPTPPKPSSYFSAAKKMAPNQANSYAGGMGVTTVNPSSTYHHIHEMVAKRISTLDYLRKTHEGRVYWFNTLLFSQPDILRLPSFQPPRLARRAAHLLLLGLSIPAAVDSNAQSALDYVKALNALLAEFENYQQMHPTDGGSSSGIGSGRFSGAKLPKMFSRGSVGGSKTRRASTATDIGLPLPPGFDSVVGGGGGGGGGADGTTDSLASSTASLTGGGGAGSGSTAAVSSASTVGSITLGGGGGPASSHGSSGGPRAPPPGSSTTTAALPAPDASMLLPGEEYAYLLTPSIPFEPDFFEVFATLSDALIDVYMRIAALVPSPERVALQPGLAEAFAKADARIRKLLVLGIVKEFEEATRAGVKGEMAGVGRVVLGGLM